MQTVGRIGDLEIDQDLEFQRRTWMVQRVGWVVMALVALAALLGLLGPGPLSNATAGNQKMPLHVAYNRFVRYQTPTQLRVHLTPETGREGKARVWLSRDYLQGVQVQQVVPTPEGVEIGSDRLTYIFRLSEPSQPTAITFYVEPEQIGPLSCHIGLGSGPPLSFSQFVYP
jgi:hypothetical protein